MAAFLKLHEDNKHFVLEVFENHRNAELYRDVEFRAAIVIQSWFRGLRTRLYLKHLNQCATTIQRIWRGFLGRNYYRQKLDNAVKKMMLDYYNDKATKIQKRWRGYFVRKYKHNFYARKRYLELVEKKNAIVREQLEDYNHQAKQEMARHLQEMRRRKIEEEAAKTHFLMSTATIPGVYNSPYRIYPHEMEFHMRAASLSPKSKPNKAKGNSKKSTNTNSMSVEACGGSKQRSNSEVGSADATNSKKEDCESPLPPIKKVQGPFRNPKDVIAQKQKALKPTLRVETDFYSLEEARNEMKLEEWRNRVVDDIWQPSTQFRYPYRKLLHGTSEYGHLKDDYLREDQAEKRVDPKDFKRVNSPVPLFERFGDTYSKGAGAIC